MVSKPLTDFIFLSYNGNMTKQTLTATTKMEPNGRVMIPAVIRNKLNLKLGTVFIVKIQDDQIILEDKMKAWRELQAYFTKDYKGKKLLSEDLIEDRRREAIHEGYV